jgi:hypothetical protein
LGVNILAGSSTGFTLTFIGDFFSTGATFVIFSEQAEKIPNKKIQIIKKFVCGILFSVRFKKN